MASYNEMFHRMSSANGTWEWCGESDIILYPNPLGSHWVIVHYLQRKRDWEAVNTFMLEYALADAKEILGRIRSKYGTVPGPNGQLTLDGPTLLQESREDKERLRQQLYDKYGADHMYMITG